MENTAPLEGNFELKEIKWRDKEHFWRATFNLTFPVKVFHNEYNVLLEYNDDNYAKQIRTIKGNIAEQRGDQTLFDDIKFDTIQRYEEAILKLENEMAKERAEHPDIEFTGYVAEVKMNFKFPVITFNINDLALEAINAKKKTIHNYKITLEPSGAPVPVTDPTL